MPSIARFAAILILTGFFCSCMRAPQLDVLISGGRVLDGTGAPSFRADVGLRADSIVFVGTIPGKVRARNTIDASGYLLTPGFIDPHTHAGDVLNDPERHANLPFLYQGVTTVVYGNDGGSPLETGKALRQMDSLGIGTNAALYVGHNSLRMRAMGRADRVPTSEEMNAMKAMLRRGMEEGALGLSAGLFYSPGNFSKTEEVIELAGVAAEYGGIYDVHQRDESSYNIGLEKAVEETLTIAEKSGIHANISHIKALGADVWGYSGRIVEMIEDARNKGLSITADQYPYSASSTSFASSLLPPWVFADDPDYRPKLSDPDYLPELKEAVSANILRRGGPESFLLTVPSDTTLAGKRLSEIAAERGIPALEAALEILRIGNSKIASFNMQEDDIRTFMKQPWVMTGSDGGEGHPRMYGSYPRKIAKYVLGEHVMSLEAMVHQSTLLPAQTLGFPDRGRIAPGMKADILVFRPEELQENATYEAPSILSSGMEYVIVNGKIAIGGGQYTGVLAGKALRRERGAILVGGRR